MILSVGDTYIEKSMGPRTEPCGTPDSHVVLTERWEPTAMYCERPVTNNLSVSIELTVWLYEHSFI